MGFSKKDRDALNRARELGLEFGVFDSGNPEYDVVRVQVGSNATALNDMHIVLADALDAAMRFHGDEATVWLEITSQVIPNYVEKALSMRKGYSMRLIVTHLKCCSHAPGDSLPRGLQEAIINMETAGRIWHPLAGEAVWADPQEVVEG